MGIGLSQTDLGTYNSGIITIDLLSDPGQGGPTTSVVYDGSPIPPDSILMYENGQHDGLDNQATLSDSSANFPIDGYNAGFTIRNTSKGVPPVAAEADITDTTATTIVGILSGSADWDEFNYYEIVISDIVSGDSIEYEILSDLGGDVSINTKGVPSITGINGLHSFQWRLHDVSDNSDSAWYTLTIEVV